jgi:hypothetical protein
VQPLGDEYTIPFFALDNNQESTVYSKFASVGGNTGTVNSFAGVDLANLTGGVYSSENFLQGNNAVCFAFQSAYLAAPGLLRGLFADITTPLNMIASAVATATSGLNCPVLNSIDTSQFAGHYPGYSQSYYGYKGRSS